MTDKEQQKKTVLINAWISEDMAEAINEKRRENLESRGAIVRDALKQYLNLE